MSKIALTEVEKKVTSQKPDSKSFDLAAYVGGKFREDLLDEEKSKLTYIGLTVPTTKQIFKDGFSFIKIRAEKIAKEHAAKEHAAKEQSAKEQIEVEQDLEIDSNQFKIWNFIFHQSDIFEVKS